MKIFIAILLTLSVFAAPEPVEKTIKDAVKDIGAKEKVVMDEDDTKKSDSSKEDVEEKEVEEIPAKGYANLVSGDCVISVTNPNKFPASVAVEVVQYESNGKRIKGFPYGFNLKGKETVTRNAKATPRTTRCDLIIKRTKISQKEKKAVKKKEVEVNAEDMPETLDGKEK